ncbi:MAG: glutamate-5-semialdehyde dehydrogenase [Candidatus Neomarinimicrobiota bacterium]
MNDNLTASIHALGRATKSASRILPTLTTMQKQLILMQIAERLEQHQAEIIAANKLDLTAARQQGMAAAMIDRLTLNDQRIAEMAAGVREVAALPDPVGEIAEQWTRPNGLQVQKRRIPLGVIGVIYESRPNVTVEAAALCFFAGNGLLLRGGSEAFHSNRALVDLMRQVLGDQELADVINMIPVTDRESVDIMARLDDCLDVIIPRGGEGLIRRVKSVATVPVIAHYKGNCHVYIDYPADAAKALAIVLNSKVPRPGVCNAAETVLVHRQTAPTLLPALIEQLTAAGVEIRGCAETQTYSAAVKPATEDDYDTEFLDLVLALRVVDDIAAAIEHIQRYSSDHTEAIVSESPENQERFVRSLDSSAIMVNASTRFNDGGQLGLGAEIGISTTKLHSFGPMGLRELTTTKFVVRGSGQVRE